jgi:hypothetical protein
MSATELQEQAALFEWAALSEGKYPALRWMHSIPNGSKRDIVTAVNLKRTGVKAGVPDICLPVARNGFHALYIELKRVSGGAVSASQRIWLNALTEQGCKAVVCKGWETARDTILDYLGGKE